MDTTSVFRVSVFKIVDIGLGGQYSFIRVADKRGILYDFKLNLSDTNFLSSINKVIDDNNPDIHVNLNSYDVIVHTSNYAGARVRTNKDGTLPLVGTDISETIFAELSTRGIMTNCELVGMSSVLNNPDMRGNVVIAQDRLPGEPLHMVDLNDEDAHNARAIAINGITGGPGGLTMGAGPYTTNTSNKGHVNHSIESTTSSTQEQGHGGGMFTTSYNFLQHYFVGIANAVALPMPHMVDIVKMVALGVFVKKVIGTKGSRNTVNGKWEGASGVYGLADTLTDIAKSKK